MSVTDRAGRTYIRAYRNRWTARSLSAVFRSDALRTTAPPSYPTTSLRFSHLSLKTLGTGVTTNLSPKSSSRMHSRLLSREIFNGAALGVSFAARSVAQRTKMLEDLQKVFGAETGRCLSLCHLPA